VVQVGSRYVASSGVEVLATKGGHGTLSDGESEFTLKASIRTAAPTAVRLGAVESARHEVPEVELGKRYRSTDGAVEVLIIRPGPCDLRYNGEPMERMGPSGGMSAGVRVPRMPWDPLQGAAQKDP
jgi:hypothetical protein